MNKICTRCTRALPLDFFHKDSRAPDGKSPRCRDCKREISAAWAAKNPDRRRANWERYNTNNADKVAASKARYMERNRERAYEAARRWQAENPHARNASTARRYAQKKQSTPAWANAEIVEWFYFDARWMTEQTGVQHEVDHFYPLRGKTVSGLHCEDNLRVIPAYENRRKNRTPPDE